MKLIRIDPQNGRGLSLVFDDAGEERRWQLGATSVVEIFALLLRGNMRQGRRVLLAEGEVALEPPDQVGGSPQLCFSTGMLEVCAPIDKAAIKALKADLDRLSRK